MQYGVGPYILDFYCSKIRLGIEVDGSPHTDTERKLYDQDRSKYLKSLDIHIIRFWNDEIFKNIKNVLDKLFNKIKQLNNK